MELKKFLRQFWIFVLLFLLMNAALIGGICIMSNNISFKLPAKKHVLIIGDSHTALGINDKYIPQAINMSSEGEGYLYAYLKLRKFLAENDQLDTVILSFNFNSMYKVKDEWTVGESYIAGKVPHYLPFFTADEFKLFAANPVFYEAVLEVPVQNKRAVVKLLTNKFTMPDLHIGGYVDSKERKIKKALEVIKEKADAAKRFDGYSVYQEEYLNKIIAACKAADVQLILLNSPIYKEALYAYNQKDFYAYYKKNLANIPMWDYYNMPYDATQFRDTDHLNA
ncbi:MAG: hypothetical protein EOP54_24490, partial [Sphingobacteriales bacterium]